jgi:hypothetical protein|tara:strand:+ start:477 stop:1031 length:555 start_codon:yes stop_codon:yes gene_type:complete
MVEVIDNWLDPEFCDHLAYDIIFNMPHFYGHRSDYSDGTPRFYRADFRENDFHIKYMCRKLSREVLKQNCQFVRVYANIQYNGMDGTFHNDDGDFTVLYMVTPTLKFNGQFQYRQDGKIIDVDFVHNRLVWFSGKDLDHRGLSPDTDLPRVTVAFKVISVPATWEKDPEVDKKEHNAITNNGKR